MFSQNNLAFIVIECISVVKDSEGNPVELICRYLPETLAGKPCADGEKVKGVIHWLSADPSHYLKAEVRLYDRLFKVENPALYEDLGEIPRRCFQNHFLVF